MKREIFNRLVKWKNKPDKTRKILMLKGARQVGKTWLLKELGETCFENYVYINLERYADTLTIFNETSNPEIIIEQLELIFETKIVPGKTLIIFDEIQSIPRALWMLKIFKEEASEYHICCAGSLLGVRIHNGISYPVGCLETIYVHPLNFKEFLIARGKESNVKYIENSSIDKLEEMSFDHLEYLLREYMFIGGMPAAVQTWLDTHDYNEVKDVLTNIEDDYRSDFSKYADINTSRKITEVWENISKQLAKENKKFIFGLVREGARAKDYSLALQWLTDASIIRKVNCIETPKLPLTAYKERDVFKVYVNDIGLLTVLNKVSPRLLLNGDNLFSEYNGALTEQFVLQELSGFEDIAYWSKNNYEVDFLIQYETDIIPVEVKAGTTVHTKSLNQYKLNYNPNISVKTSLRGFKYQDGVINIPLYMLWALKSILNKLTDNSIKKMTIV